MIICFSGTGNSRIVSDHLQELLGDELVRFPPGLLSNPRRITLDVTDDRVIWVFPIYSWGLPRCTQNVMEQAKFETDGQVVHHMVCTCGDDMGYADRIWRQIIERRGHKTGSAFSVLMPNTYTLLKGFDVDPKDVEQAKLEAAPRRVEEIADMIEAYPETRTDVVRGSWPWVKSYVLRWWFNRFLMSPKPFHATDACNSCGKCARNCPMGTIKIAEGKPRWIGQCTMCLRCYHCCPKHAVHYGNATKNKGQYICPGYSLKS